MAKPDIAGELTDVHVNSISLVDKAANKRKFAIFKSASEPAAENEPTEQKRFFDVVKAFFVGEKTVEKGEMADTYHARDKAEKFINAETAFREAIGFGYGGPPRPETDAKKIREALQDFSKIVMEIMTGTDEAVKKFASEVTSMTDAAVEKAGRKLSGARRAKLQSVYEVLGELLSETDDESSEGSAGDVGEVTKGADIMDAEKVKEVVKGALDEAMKPIAERIEKLEQAENDAATANEGAQTEEQPDVGEVVKAAVEEALKPFAERLEKVEKARGVSNAVKDEANEVKKSVEDVFGGVFD